MSDLNPYEEGLAVDLAKANDRIRQLQQALKDHSSVSDRLAEQLDAARADAKEAEAYVEELAGGQVDLYCQLISAEGKLAKLVEALREMCAEFRGHDLPYGSKAYAKATSVLAEMGVCDGLV